jgi:hypothetical protein
LTWILIRAEPSAILKSVSHQTSFDVTGLKVELQIQMILCAQLPICSRKLCSKRIEDRKQTEQKKSQNVLFGFTWYTQSQQIIRLIHSKLHLGHSSCKDVFPRPSRFLPQNGHVLGCQQPPILLLSLVLHRNHEEISGCWFDSSWSLALPGTISDFRSISEFSE